MEQEIKNINKEFKPYPKTIAECKRYLELSEMYRAKGIKLSMDNPPTKEEIENCPF